MKTSLYHKSATRDLRPFYGVGSLERALDSAAIRLYDGQPFTDATSFTVESQDVARLDIALRPNLDDTVLAASAIARQQLVLAVIAFNPFLKKVRVISAESLHKRPPEEFAIDVDILEPLGGGSQLTIELAICLGKKRPRRPGTPFLLGHWIAKKSFDLHPPKLPEDFDVHPLDDAGWKARGLPAKTLYLVEYFGFVNEPASKDKPIAKVYIHSDVHRKLSVDTNQRAAKPLLAFLAAEITSQILHASVSDWEGAEQPEPRSPLSAFLKRVSRIRPCTLGELRTMVKEPGILRLRSMLHADQQSVRAIAES